MKKSKIIKNFKHMPCTDQKEQFMRDNGIEYSYDEFNNMTVYADDGTLRLFPIDKEM